MTSSNTPTVSVRIEIREPSSGRVLHQEVFTHTPHTYYRDRHTRLFSAKLAYRQRWAELTADTSSPLHQYHNARVEYWGELAESPSHG